MKKIAKDFGKYVLNSWAKNPGPVLTVGAGLLTTVVNKFVPAPLKTPVKGVLSVVLGYVSHNLLSPASPESSTLQSALQKVTTTGVK